MDCKSSYICGGGVNASIFEAASPEFEVVISEYTKTLNTRSALVVLLPPRSP